MKDLGFKKGDAVEVTLAGDLMHTGTVTRVYRSKGYATIRCNARVTYNVNLNGAIPAFGLKVRKAQVSP